MFRRFRENNKLFINIYLESLHIHLNPPQNVSPVLLLNGLVIVTHEKSIAWKCFTKGKVRGYSL